MASVPSSSPSRRLTIGGSNNNIVHWKHLLLREFGNWYFKHTEQMLSQSHTYSRRSVSRRPAGPHPWSECSLRGRSAASDRPRAGGWGSARTWWCYPPCGWCGQPTLWSCHPATRWWSGQAWLWTCYNCYIPTPKPGSGCLALHWVLLAYREWLPDAGDAHIHRGVDHLYLEAPGQRSRDVVVPSLTCESHSWHSRLTQCPMQNK